ncbi:hypothetical protein DL96DRAFT_1596131 [Flagelloscypha sp. PMI_526]|nr:hypothetical protein DL96DRAFT_1596131 [Flagelloscypha sp. PMI_526]
MPRQSRSSARPAARPCSCTDTERVDSKLLRLTSLGMRPIRQLRLPIHQAAAQQAQTSSGPGMLTQMAATAGSVAVGSTIGHGLSSMLFGGSSSAPAEQQAPAPTQHQNTSINCELQAKDFTKCLDKADLNSCSYYLEQLKACQAAAAPY